MATTTVLLIGYAIPGFVLGIVLLVLFGGGSFWSFFPLRGLTSDNWAGMTLCHKVLDYLWQSETNDPGWSQPTSNGGERCVSSVILWTSGTASWGMTGQIGRAHV